MRWPGRIPAGTSCNELSATIDLLPTLAALIGSELPSDRVIDGHDIRPLLFEDSAARTPHEFYCYYKGEPLLALRSGRWKIHFG